MADNYYTSGSIRDVQVLSPSKTIPVEMAEAFTIPSNVYFEFPIPLDLWTQNQGADYLGAIAGGIEDLIAQGMVVGGNYIQTTDVSGLLVDYMDLIVQYRPANGIQGTFEGTVRVPLNTFVAAVDPFFGRLAGSPQALVLAEWERLKALAEL
jgi:hypothetical protein